MQDDRELLELAAKAAGVTNWIKPGYGYEWNPLDDDGDEARLESALEMHVEWHVLWRTVKVGTADTYATEMYGYDRQAARRRAGVRAAAEIGRGMSGKQG